MSFLTMTDVSMKFWEKTVLQPTTLKLEKSKILGVVGHNGAGKTTLFKLILEMKCIVKIKEK